MQSIIAHFNTGFSVRLRSSYAGIVRLRLIAIGLAFIGMLLGAQAQEPDLNTPLGNAQRLFSEQHISPANVRGLARCDFIAAEILTLQSEDLTGIIGSLNSEYAALISKKRPTNSFWTNSISLEDMEELDPHQFRVRAELDQMLRYWSFEKHDEDRLLEFNLISLVGCKMSDPKSKLFEGIRSKERISRSRNIRLSNSRRSNPVI